MSDELNTNTTTENTSPSSNDDQLMYIDTLSGGKHWSLIMRKGSRLRLTDVEGGANVGMLFYNPNILIERYNAPDTLKCQHTFRLTKGHCLYSDMGRIFCSIIEDSFGWHDTVCGNTTAETVIKKWGKKNYQDFRNDRYQNGYDSFLIEMGKYDLGRKDMASNVNWFSKVSVAQDGSILYEPNKTPNAQVDLRFEMDTLVVLHTCPHPLNPNDEYPMKPVTYEILKAAPVSSNDFCRTSCPENERGFRNTELYQW